MKVFVINGDCITTNSSANLCHLAYINGLVASGCDVTLLSADGRDYDTDKSMVIPPQVKSYTYYGVTLYEKLSLKKSRNAVVSSESPNENIKNEAEKQSVKSRIIKKIKSMALGSYGVHGIYSKFVKAANKFSSDTEFDYIISLSTPPSSHLIAYNLLKSKHIKGKKWIQIWEDPWYSDVYGFSGKDKILREEKRLLSFAQRICYVSPITLKNQQKVFPEYAENMYWQPLPYYYKNEEAEPSKDTEKTFGYFGAYYPAARNLKPFYNAAIKTGIETNICGDPSSLLAECDNIHIYPRLSLQDLKIIEDKTSVLIFLCNRQGGQIPGKIYQYSATDKTILFILDGTDEEKRVLKDFFEPFKRYVFCENTEEDIIRAINLIKSNDLGDIKNRPLEDFNPKTTIKKILEG